MEKTQLQPKIVFDCFAEVNKIPRPSNKEEKMMAYLMDFGHKLGLETLQDETGNVLIRKPATPGYENLETTVVQSHMDMVCEKVAGLDFDFENDAIQTYVDGEWMKAKGTTLGADDGIGVAMQMALLADDSIEHGPIECLFTRAEETSLGGASGIKPGFNAERTGVVMGTALDGMALLADTQARIAQGEIHKASPRLVPMVLGNMAACLIAMRYGFHGASLTVNTACSSGGDAIMTAAMLLRSGELDCAGLHPEGARVGRGDQHRQILVRHGGIQDITIVFVRSPGDLEANAGCFLNRVQDGVILRHKIHVHREFGQQHGDHKGFIRRGEAHHAEGKQQRQENRDQFLHGYFLLINN